MADDEPVGAEVTPVEGEIAAESILSSVDPECIDWVKTKVHLEQGSSIDWQPEHDETIAEFVASTTSQRLFVFIDSSAQGLTVQIGCPQVAPGQTTEIQYFLKPAKATLTTETIAKSVQYGTVNGEPVGALLRLMSGVFVPLCLKDESWPDTIKKEFSGQLHRFMASLTETAWDQRGSTVLYIPSEDLDNPEMAAKQKDLVQRFESTLIHWTRQIKEVVNRQDDGDDAEDVS
jgi:dynein heavy chain